MLFRVDNSHEVRTARYCLAYITRIRFMRGYENVNPRYQFSLDCGAAAPSRRRHSSTRRAALSIAANIAEGNGRFTKPDRRSFFEIARGSVQECVPLLELARRRGLLDPTDHATLRSQLEEIARMLSGLINGLDKRPH